MFGKISIAYEVRSPEKPERERFHTTNGIVYGYRFWVVLGEVRFEVDHARIGPIGQLQGVYDPKERVFRLEFDDHDKLRQYLRGAWTSEGLTELAIKHLTDLVTLSIRFGLAAFES